MASTIVKSVSTGKYHFGGANAVSCNHSGQRKRPRLSLPSRASVEAAQESSFCKKCFWSGKPDAERLNRIYECA